MDVFLCFYPRITEDYFPCDIRVISDSEAKYMFPSIGSMVLPRVGTY